LSQGLVTYHTGGRARPGDWRLPKPLAEEAHDPLHARALVLADGSTKVAIVVVDSCFLPRALIGRAKARAETAIPTNHMLVAATHTHSAPPSKPEGASAIKLAYQQLLETTQIAQSVIEADKRLEPVQIGWAVR
jgi:neutral ceramidase